ncbi:serine hydrolase domain-containing protein, partial [Arthrobacter sp.]|uniref:serine hydrolase domain-containing protein n=1 Tax=Arthrobacter sp. TaxID=1667 RepID=UPI00281254DD
MSVVLVGGASGAAVAAGTSSTSPGPAANEQGYEVLDRFLQEQIDSIGIPGVAVVVVQHGVQVHSAAFGNADSGRPMTAQTPVLLASTTKSLTTIAVMQQVEAGRLQLDEPVQTYLPWFTLKDSRSSEITVRH